MDPDQLGLLDLRDRKVQSDRSEILDLVEIQETREQLELQVRPDSWALLDQLATKDPLGRVDKLDHRVLLVLLVLLDLQGSLVNLVEMDHKVKAVRQGLLVLLGQMDNLVLPEGWDLLVSPVRPDRKVTPEMQDYQDRLEQVVSLVHLDRLEFRDQQGLQGYRVIQDLRGQLALVVLKVSLETAVHLGHQDLLDKQASQDHLVLLDSLDFQDQADQSAPLVPKAIQGNQGLTVS